MTRTALGTIAALACALVLASCTATDDTVGTGGEVRAEPPLPARAGTPSSEPKPPSTDCGDPTAQSIRPTGTLPTAGQMPAGTTMARIQARGKLVVGVDQNTYQFGYRDPFTGEIEGFDIDMAKSIAQAIFGNPNSIQLKILTSGQRIPALRAGDVDIVIRTMSITCDRLKDVAFSSVYYEANQRVLVKKNSGYTGIDSLGGKKVCATEGSTSLANIAEADGDPVPFQVQDWTDCLVLLQQNQVDAISTDDTILIGMTAQDPFTEVVGAPIDSEPYGMAMPLGEDDFVQFVNAVLERMRTDGTWKATYDKWLAALLGPAPAPPAARYRN
jgi:polar amino acid transport system substrate-binding protein